ncbi:MAG: DUF4350 domain-containing protein [Candidatus Eisenbacteria bacterium]|nr:DUF4350 domain-containing protein [Candidatus Eisenbacteria bacterium]
MRSSSNRRAVLITSAAAGLAALVALTVLWPAAPAAAQQVADSTFLPVVGAPAYAAGEGPLVQLDEAHHNFHTASGRFLPFARLLERDGYRVEPQRERFTRAALARTRVLVVSNALADDGDWVLPARPAFTADEVAAVRDWVNDGGSLLLIADHMPFPGHAQALAAALGVAFQDGFALDADANDRLGRFRRVNGSLATHPVTQGRDASERVDSVRTFTGQAFRLLHGGTPLLVFDSTCVVWLPQEAWQFGRLTPHVPGEGMVQGALLELGRGRVAVFGEAAMFSAQRSGPNRNPSGMNAPGAERNGQFVLNLMHWLTRLPGLEPETGGTRPRPRGGR